ncbi:aluminum-activated malate transporter 8-like [Salvia hispanica]|uniref:aluminum-activated malate transporter 8-like n=1 Tax=Salvia hispanica TaxID=49212 RepID=UPI00200996E7|nr:aluminum-activated malate transporter 8-like [Salvia hispanica]
MASFTVIVVSWNPDDIHYHDVFFQASSADGLLSITTILALFEYTVGATLAKGLNRLFATCLGVALGYGMHHSAALMDKYSVVIGLSVTFIVTIATYCRFFPKVKDMFDECFSTFMASFTVIMVSWSPDDTTLKGECLRLIAIWVAGIMAILICIFVFPDWAGEDLHVGTADNIDRLARYLEDYSSCFRLKGVALDYAKGLNFTTNVKDANGIKERDM